MNTFCVAWPLAPVTPPEPICLVSMEDSLGLLCLATKQGPFSGHSRSPDVCFWASTATRRIQVYSF